MTKSINLGNGELLIGLDKYGQVKDLYYHYPGLENHVGNNLVHKIGVYLEERFSWIDDGSWEIEISTVEGAMASSIKASNKAFGLDLVFNDIVYNEKNIFIRKVKVVNKDDRPKEVRLFFNQQFDISETHIGDTAYFDPREDVLIHYKGRRVFLINLLTENSRGFDEYSIGLLGIEGQVGTYIDATDGELSGNPIEHGSVDSVVMKKILLEPKKDEKIYYWITVSKSIDFCKKLNEEILSRHPEEIIKSTTNYWRAWASVRNINMDSRLNDEWVDLFQKSLFIIRAHTSNNGAIIASGDSEMLQFGRDYYRYVWPRDASFTAIALTKAGDFNAAKNYFRFSSSVITKEGYFMHKYRPDKSLGSSWHPWVRGDKKQFPIQEDETALVIWSLWKYYEFTKDLEFIEEMFNPLIKKASDFMVSYIDEKTGLPRGSYDLWEQEYGISTFTASTVYGALNKASNLASILGKTEVSDRYRERADMIKKSILKYLYSSDGYFYKSIDTTTAKPSINKTIDSSSFFGICEFEVIPLEDLRVKKAFKSTLEKLWVRTNIEGVSRYDGDSYHHKGGDYPGNPWIITTLWIAQYYIKIAKNSEELGKAKELIEWILKFASKSGILSEQIDPYSGIQLSASPLVWSHAEYVTTLIDFAEKVKLLESSQ